MAELTTPSAAAMFDAKDTTNGIATEKKKPEKPDESAYQAALKKAEKEFADAQKKFNETRAKLDVARPASNDSPTAKRRAEVITRLGEIRSERGAGKTGRDAQFDQIKRLDEQLKSRMAEQTAARAKLPYKSVGDIDREIERLDRDVNSGQMKLVDEKKALAEISNLRKQRKGFAGLDDAQKGIDDVKAKLAELRAALNDPAAKALQDESTKLKQELDSIKAEQDEAYKSISTLRKARDDAYKFQQEKWLAIRAVQDTYFKAKKAFWQYEDEARQRARERQKAEQESYNREKRKDRAEKMLQEAQDPAYMDEIRRGESLLRYFDPSSTTTAAPLLAPSGMTAAASRTVDDAGLKGTRLVKKDQEDYFAGTGGKKGKKGRKNVASPTSAASPSAGGKFSCPPSVMEDCSAMGIDPPMSAAEVPAVVEKVKEKVTHWKADQKAQTERNVSKAKKEIERLDAEEAEAKTTTNGQAKTEDKSFITQATEAVSDAVSGAAETVSDTVAQVTEGIKSMAAGENKE